MRKLVSVTLLILCASLVATQAAEYYTKHKGDERRAEPDEGMALVYVFRPASAGGAIKTWSFADDELIGLSKAKGYYFAQIPPGKHLIWSAAENTSGLDVELEAGETYYFQTAIRMGIGKARVKLVPATETEAEKFFKKCSYTEPTEEGRLRAVEIAAKRQEHAESSATKRAEKAKGK